MKKLILLITLIALAGCNNETPLGQMLRGEHQIRAITTDKDLQGNISGAYFLFVGQMSGDVSTITKLRFAWLGNDGNYIISDIPVNKIRIKIDNSKEIPTVKFKWIGCFRTDTESFDKYLLYALIICKEKDMPQQNGENLQQIFNSNKIEK